MQLFYSASFHHGLQPLAARAAEDCVENDSAGMSVPTDFQPANLHPGSRTPSAPPAPSFPHVGLDSHFTGAHTRTQTTQLLTMFGCFKLELAPSA